MARPSTEHYDLSETEKPDLIKLIYNDPPFDIGADFSMDIETDGETFHKEPTSPNKSPTAPSHWAGKFCGERDRLGRSIGHLAR